MSAALVPPFAHAQRVLSVDEQLRVEAKGEIADRTTLDPKQIAQERTVRTAALARLNSTNPTIARLPFVTPNTVVVTATK